MTPSRTDAVSQGLPACLARLWRYALVLSGDRSSAEDLVQATALRALERADQFTPGTRLDRWLFSILRSLWFNEVRSRRVRMGEGTVDAEETLVFRGDCVMETNILAAQVLREVMALSEGQREAVFLVYVEGHSYAQAAEALAIPVGTVMSRLAAARLRLATLNREDGPGARGHDGDR